MKTRGLFVMAAAVAASIGFATQATAAMTGNTLNIAVGTDVTRTWADVQAANYAYGPKQQYDSGTGQTKVWLPYGNIDGVYSGLYNASFISEATPNPDPYAATPAIAASGDAQGNFSVTYKLHFDKPISAFSASLPAVYLQLAAGNSGDKIDATFGYSVDAGGASWGTLRTVESPLNAWFGPFAQDQGVTGLNTQDLYLAFSVYAPNFNNGYETGSSRYAQLRMSGAPSWGEDAFFGNQLQVSVTAVPEPAVLSLFAGATALMALRRRREVR